MPRNARPGGIFGDLDYGWNGTTLSERIQAQNQWDLLAEQERANDLRQAQLQQSANQNLYLLTLQTMITNCQDSIRRLEIHDRFGISEQAIRRFNSYIFPNPKDTSPEALKLENTYNEYKKQYDELVESAPEEEADISEYELEIENIQAKLNKIIFKFLHKQRVADLREEIVKVQDKIAIAQNNYMKEKDAIFADYNKKLKKCKQLMDAAQLKIDNNAKQRTEVLVARFKDCVNFRLTHYNEEIEALFDELHVLGKINPLEVKKRGTVKDYITYINKKLEEL